MNQIALVILCQRIILHWELDMHTLKRLTERQYFLMGLCPTDTSAAQCSESENSIVVMETTAWRN